MGRLNSKAEACKQLRPHPDIPSSEERLPEEQKEGLGMCWKPSLRLQADEESSVQPADQHDDLEQLLTSLQQSKERVADDQAGAIVWL